MANSRYYSSIALPTTVTSPVGPADTTINVASVTGFPLTLPYTLALDYGASNEELVQVNNVGGLALDVTRAIDGTAASSHNPGAVVRHVSSARDFTDSRTHEASSSGVHGVVGAVVGTTDSQTLTNKNLTAPTIAGGTISGTFSGTAAFSGAITIGGLLTANNGINVTTSSVNVARAAAGNVAYRSSVTGDPNDRFVVQAGGTTQWGPGSGLVDTNLFRSAAATLRTDGSFIVGGGLTVSSQAILERAATTNSAWSVRVTGDTNPRWLVNAGGELSWGPGNAAADTNLYRSAPNTLRTDDALSVGQGITVSTGNVVVTTGDVQAQVTTLADGAVFTAASGFTLTNAQFRKVNGVATLRVAVTKTGATVTTNAAGNLSPDLQIGTAVVAARTVGMGGGIRGAYDVNSTFSGIATYNTDGTIELVTLYPQDATGYGGSAANTGKIVAGDVVVANFTFVQ